MQALFAFAAAGRSHLLHVVAAGCTSLSSKRFEDNSATTTRTRPIIKSDAKFGLQAALLVEEDLSLSLSLRFRLQLQRELDAGLHNTMARVTSKPFLFLSLSSSANLAVAAKQVKLVVNFTYSLVVSMSVSQTNNKQQTRSHTTQRQTSDSSKRLQDEDEEELSCFFFS